MNTQSPRGDGVGVNGVIVEVDEGVARVLIGEAEEEWYFPLTMLADDAAVGMCIVLTLRDERYVPLGKTEVPPRATARTFEERLNRPIIAHKIAEARLQNGPADPGEGG